VGDRERAEHTDFNSDQWENRTDRRRR